MKKVLLISLVSFILIIPVKAIDYSFSIGTIGGSGLFSQNTKAGYLEGSLFDFYFTDNSGNIGLYLSPFNYFIADHGGLTVVNATLFHKTFKTTDTFFVGPFIGIQWIDFTTNIPTLKAGIKLSIRDALSFDVFGMTVQYKKPVYFNYVDIELGVINRDKINQGYFSIKTDASALGALFGLLFYSEAGKNTEKYVPEYKERLPK